MGSTIVEVSKEDLQKVLLGGTHLHSWQGKGEEGILEVYLNQRMVQLDPLNPAGRNHDFFFASRIPDYKAGEFENIMYGNKVVFEAYWPNLFAIHRDYYPVFRARKEQEGLPPYAKRTLKQLEAAHPGSLNDVLKFVRDNGPTKADDLAHLGSADPRYAMWKSKRVGGNVLELLWLKGQITVINRDENFRKTYDVVDKYFDPKLLIEPDNIDFQREIFKITQKSFPLIPLGSVSVSKTGKTRLGRRKRLSASWFDEEGFAVILRIRGEKSGYAAPTNWDDLMDLKPDDEMRALGPLDPFVYDRELTQIVFDFEYAWEVYKKAKDRKWGYYVFPLLYRGELIGRMEAKYEKKTKILNFFNLQLETNVELANEVENAFNRLIERWQSMVGAEKAESDDSFSKFVNF